MLKTLKNLTAEFDRFSNLSHNINELIKFNWMKKLEAIDLIAITILVIGMILKIKGADGTVSILMSSVAFYYFGKKASSLPNTKSQDKNKIEIQ